MKKFLPTAGLILLAFVISSGAAKADCPSCGPYHGPECPGNHGRICYDDIGIHLWCEGACDNCVDGDFCPMGPGHVAIVAYTPIVKGSESIARLEARHPATRTKSIMVGANRARRDGNTS